MPIDAAQMPDFTPPEWMRRQQVEMLIKLWFGIDRKVTTEQADKFAAELAKDLHDAH